MLTKLTYLLQVTTDPMDRESAIPHTGGWSESFWMDGQQSSGAAFIPNIARARAGLLPKQASVNGFRLAYYNISGNKLLPQGSATGKFLYPGNASRVTDLPQVALEIAATTAGGPNTTRFTMRGMPDEIIVGGEYQPSAVYKGLVTSYLNTLAGGTGNLGWVGRDLSLPVARVVSITNGVVELDGVIGAIVGSYVRFNRTKDSAGNPLSGAYRISAMTAGNSFTCPALAGVTAQANGTCRVDALKFFDFATLKPSRAVTRKVGRPFESYRGRASKRAA